MKDQLPVKFRVCDGKLHIVQNMGGEIFVHACHIFFNGEVFILFSKLEAYTPEIIFLTKNVEYFPRIYYGRYTLNLKFSAY